MDKSLDLVRARMATYTPEQVEAQLRRMREESGSRNATRLERARQRRRRLRELPALIREAEEKLRREEKKLR